MKLMPKTACDICLAYDAKGRLASAVPVYHYYLQDHLGNNRVVVKQDGTIEQVNHYYPFGGLFGESTDGDVQRFKYNGKELERMHGLDWYDYDARHLDAALGRWATVDPMAEKYYHLSPYNYCGNNPIKFIDPDGGSYSDYYDLKGNYLGSDGINDNNKYIVLVKDEQKIVKSNYKGGNYTSLAALSTAISVPSVAVMNMANDAFEKSSSIEHGFVVATDGTTSKMFSGESGSVKLGYGYEELESHEKTTAFDVHTHPFDYQNVNGRFECGDYRPSGLDNGRGDILYRGIKEQNNQVTQPSWILGSRPNSDPQYGKPNTTSVVTFYNSKGVISTVEWNKFVKTVNKINQSK